MNDLPLFSLVRSVILDCLALQGVTDVEVLQTYQPTQQGAESGPAVYLFKITDNRHGHPQKRTALLDDALAETVTQEMETTIQCSARVTLDPSDLTALTAGDLVNLVAGILASPVALERLVAQNVGVYRIQAIRAPFVINDYDRNDSAPSFDFVLTHKRALAWTVPAVETFELGIYRV